MDPEAFETTEEGRQILAYLEEKGLVSGASVKLTPFGGGVSSDVWRVDSDRAPFVLKRSVSKLRVKADWFSDPARLRYEFLYLRTVGEFLPDAVPRLLGNDPDAPYLAMEFLGHGYETWKALLLAGRCEENDARRAGSILGSIHASTRNKQEIQQRFDTLEFFTQLRLDAYLRTTASHHPGPVGEAICQEADRLSAHAECLVHGDYSPKNMLTSQERFVILDCETACFCDPAFDLAFLLNHICLKALYHASADCSLSLLAAAVIEGYRTSDPDHAAAVETRTAILLPMLQIARVDGKSPVKYLNAAKQECVRLFACEQILRGSANLEHLLEHWFEFLKLRAPVFPTH